MKSNHFYMSIGRASGKSNISFKQLIELIDNGYEITFVESIRGKKELKLVDTPDEILKKVYEHFGIKTLEQNPNTAQAAERASYFHRLYSIEPFEHGPLFPDTNTWPKVNPYLDAVLMEPNIIAIKIEKK